MRGDVSGLVAMLFAHESDKLAFRRLFTRLYLRQPDGALTTALLPKEDLASRWTGRTPFDDMLRSASKGDFRLLRVNSLLIGGHSEREYLSLGHDALAPVAARWDEE